jgi:molecular chaperone HscC
LHIGIDLGTTNSVVAAFVDGNATVIPNALGHDLTPSVVSVDEDGSILVGLPARERLVTHPQQTAATFKRYMGTSRTLQFGKRALRPEELSSFVLRSLKADAEAHLAQRVTEAVVTVPAYFNDSQRKATRAAAELAGLRVERLLNEPTAAALAYGLHQRDAERKFLVFDLGGGTFDVSLLEMFEGVMEVRASAGDNFLGGEDFVNRLMDGFVHHVGKPELLKDRAVQGLLREQAERAKRALSTEPVAEMVLQHGGQRLAYRVDEEKLEKLSQPLLDRLRTPIERALRDAKIRARDLDEVVLVGGATRMPIVRRLVAKLFARLPAGHIDPDRVVALGAAVQAGLKARDAALKDVVMTDVCPYTLGIQVAKRITHDRYEAGHYMPIIERNTVIPASRVQTVTTLGDFDREVTLEVSQGEGRLVKDNVALGSLRVPVQPKPAGEEAIDVRFTYDINGLLEVEATVQSTKQVHSVVIEGNPGVLTPKEIAARLAALAELKIHPREKTENRALLARAERLYQERLGEVRHAIEQHTMAFERALATQDPRQIEQSRTQLSVVLDRLEGDPYL